MALDLALVVDAEDAPGEVDADAPRALAGGALDEGGVLQRGAGLAVDVAGDEIDAPLRVAELGLDLLIGAERRVADAQVGDGEVAEAEVEYLVEEMVAVLDLGIFGGAEIGEDAVRAEHEEERRVLPGTVGAAREAVDRLGRSRGLEDIGLARRKEGVDNQAAGDGDGGAGEGLRP